MEKIVRRPDRAEGGITPEEKVRLDAHAQMWIKRIMRTDPIEPDKIVPAIEGLYAAAGLKKPRVVIVPSPLVMAFAYGAASAILSKPGKGGRATQAATHAATRAATRAATLDATYAATDAATDAATYDATLDATLDATRAATDAATDVATRVATYVATRVATYDATRDATDVATLDATRAATYAATDAATDVATRVATYVATRDATYDATRDATDVATLDATRAATYAATDVATRVATYDATRDAASAPTLPPEKAAASACLELAGDVGLKKAASWGEAYQGGNMWGQYDSWLTAMRDIIGLRLPQHEKYAAWEAAAIHGGFRVMHADFCIVSDFPEVLKVDEQNRPHCETGPSHRWRDGWELFHWHGVKVPGEWITNRASLTAGIALSQDNVELRRAACEILGWSKVLSELKAKTIDADDDPEIGSLVEVSLPDAGESRFLRVRCGTGRDFALPVPREMKTALEAQAWTWGLDKKTFIKPEIRT